MYEGAATGVAVALRDGRARVFLESLVVCHGEPVRPEKLDYKLTFCSLNTREHALRSRARLVLPGRKPRSNTRRAMELTYSLPQLRVRHLRKSQLGHCVSVGNATRVENNFKTRSADLCEVGSVQPVKTMGDGKRMKLYQPASF